MCRGCFGRFPGVGIQSQEVKPGKVTIMDRFFAEHGDKDIVEFPLGDNIAYAVVSVPLDNGRMHRATAIRRLGDGLFEAVTHPDHSGMGTVQVRGSAIVCPHFFSSLPQTVEA